MYMNQIIKSEWLVLINIHKYLQIFISIFSGLKLLHNFVLLGDYRKWFKAEEKRRDKSKTEEKANSQLMHDMTLEKVIDEPAGSGKEIRSAFSVILILFPEFTLLLY